MGSVTKWAVHPVDSGQLHATANELLPLAELPPPRPDVTHTHPAAGARHARQPGIVDGFISVTLLQPVIKTADKHRCVSRDTSDVRQSEVSAAVNSGSAAFTSYFLSLSPQVSVTVPHTCSLHHLDPLLAASQVIGRVGGS